MRYGTEPVTKHDRSSLRVLGSVGEPINPEAWRWYYSIVGDAKCAIVDTYWYPPLYISYTEWFSVGRRSQEDIC